jgi:quinol monooxygenase YgiN
MITVTGTFTAKKEKVEIILAGAQAVQRASLANDRGCHEYKFHQLSDNPASFFVYEIWEDMESLQKHGNSAHFHEFAALLEGSLDAELDIRVYNAI